MSDTTGFIDEQAFAKALENEILINTPFSKDDTLGPPNMSGQEFRERRIAQYLGIPVGHTSTLKAPKVELHPDDCKITNKLSIIRPFLAAVAFSASLLLPMPTAAEQPAQIYTTYTPQ